MAEAAPAVGRAGGFARTWAARTALLLAIAGLAVLHLAALAHAFAYPDLSFQDFRCYFIATSLYELNGNPYFLAENVVPFVYLPSTLWLFKLFTWLSVQDGSRFWLITRCGVLGGLLWIWHRRLGLRIGLLQILILLSAFTFCIMQDLATGNVSIIEQAVLWGAFAALMRRRYAWFAVGIAAAAQFKLMFLILTPCVFLVDPGEEGRRRQWETLGAALALFAGSLAVSYIIWANWLHDMSVNMRLIDYDGANCDPCARAFLQDCAAAAAPVIGAAAARAASLAMPILALGAAAIFSAGALIRYRSLCKGGDPLVQLLFVTVVFALISPRLKLYSFVLVLPALLYLSLRARHWTDYLVVALCLMPTRNLVYPLPDLPLVIGRSYATLHVPRLLSDYTSLFGLVGLWLRYVHLLYWAEPQSVINLHDHHTTPLPNET